MKVLFKLSAKFRTLLLLLLLGSFGLGVSGCIGLSERVKEREIKINKTNLKQEKMNMTISNDVAIKEITKAQFTEMAKNFLESERVIVEPFYEKIIIDDYDDFLNHHIGANTDSEVLVFFQSIRLISGYWEDSNDDMYVVGVTVNGHLDGFRQFSQGSAIGDGEVVNNVLVNFMPIVRSNSPQFTGSYHNDTPAKIQLMGWRAYRY